jgi:plasmid maintenance system antidote protein VapI
MDSQWLKTQFAANPDKSKAGLAAAIGLEPPAVSKILNGTRQIKAQEYLQMREYFGLPVDGLSAVRKTYTVKAQDGQDGFDDGSAPPSEWSIPSVISSQAAGPNKTNRVFQVRESFMEPEFKRGEHVLVDIALTANLHRPAHLSSRMVSATCYAIANTRLNPATLR